MSSKKELKQEVKKQANIRKANERLLALQEIQGKAAKARSIGLSGSNDEALANKWDEYLAKQAKEDARDRASGWLEVAIGTPVFGERIKGWLKDRINQDPIVVKGLVVRFLGRGANLEMSDAVSESFRKLDERPVAS